MMAAFLPLYFLAAELCIFYLPNTSSGETRNKFITNTEKTITTLGVKSSSARLAKMNDVVIASAGQGHTRGQTSLCKIDTYINQSIISIRANSDFLDAGFLFYNLSNRYDELRQISDGNSIRGSITTKFIKALKLPLPIVKEQQAIAATLSCLDNKIELNNRINKTLEEMAQAIFKSWFVDFEPFLDGEFEDSELGKIPKGWRVGTIKSISKDIICGKTPSTKEKANYGDFMPFITIPDMHGNVYITKTERYLSEQGVNTQLNKILPKHSIVVSCIATPGLVVLTSEESQTNQQINSIICENNISSFYIFLYMKILRDKIKDLGSGGSTTLNLNKTNFSKIKILIPNQEVMWNFHKLVDGLFALILENQKLNHNLIAIRDSLLPKLMSGEIRVPIEEVQ